MLYKPSEAIKYFEKLMEAPRSNNDIISLGYSTTEKEESSRSSEKGNNKVKNINPTCHHYGKLDHKKNFYRRNTRN